MKRTNSIKRIFGFYKQKCRWGGYDKKGLCPTLTASMGMGGGFIPMVTRRFKIDKTDNVRSVRH